MGAPHGISKQPDAGSVLQEHRTRIRALEGNPAGGIRFDTFPQDGDWLYVATTDGSVGPFGLGMYFKDGSASFPQGGIKIQTLHNDIFLDAGSSALDGGELVLRGGNANAYSTLRLDGGLNYFEAGTGLGVNFQIVDGDFHIGQGVSPVGGQFFVYSIGHISMRSQTQIDIHVDGPGTRVQLAAGLSVFEFRDDGTIHGPTGGSIIWDL